MTYEEYRSLRVAYDADNAREIVERALEREEYCGYNLDIDNCEWYLGGDDMAKQWLLDEGGYNISDPDHSMKDIAIMLEGLYDADDEYGFFALNAYGWIHFITFIDAANDIIDAYCANNLDFFEELINDEVIEVRKEEHGTEA